MKARAALATYVDSLNQPGAASQIGSLVKTNMLAGVSAPAKGIFGNIPFAGFKVLAQQPAEAGIDAVQSWVRSARTGFKVKPHEFREVVNALDFEGLRSYKGGFKKGIKTITDGHTEGRAAMKNMPPGTPFADRIAEYTGKMQLQLQADASRLGINTPTNLARTRNSGLRAYMEGTFGAVEAVDRPFFEGAFDMSVYMQAKLSAVRQNLKGVARQAEIERLLKNPTAEMELRALDDAMYATFKDRPEVAKGLERMRGYLQSVADDIDNTRDKRIGAGVSAVLMDAIMPFTGVPSSIVAKGTSIGPLGLLSPKMFGTQAQRSRAIANAAIGTPMIYAGMKLAEAGILTGSPSRSSNQRADDNDTGRGSYKLKVNGNWVDLRTVGPPAFPFFVGADIYSKLKREPDAGFLDVASTGAASIGRALVENSFAQGTSRAIEAVKDENKGAAFFAGLGGIAVPSVVSQASRAIDDKPREAKTFGEKIQARTPLSMLLPEKLTPRGSPPGKTIAERLSPFSPIPITKDRSTVATEEIRRLGLSVGLPERTTGIDNESVEIPREQYEGMVNRQGDSLFAAAERLIANPQYQALTDEEKKDRMRKLINRERDKARKPVRSELRRSLGLEQPQ
jgi:hypothetical protein